MVFSSPIFLFGFLPIVLAFYYLSPRIIKNSILLAASLFFYAWGETFYLGILIASIISNYIFGILIHSSNASRLYTSLGIIINLVLLLSFKYVNFIVHNINRLFIASDIPTIEFSPIHLPLGISFFTFQAISYLVSVYKKNVNPQRNLLDLALYIALFSQLIAGPIIRYKDVAEQLKQRIHSLSLIASGIRRFTFGLAKKILIANTLGQVADSAFLLSGSNLTLPIAWIGISAFALQIYFDFSGYSDMAIGLGRIFGFKFLKNFNYPYISSSLREFWRRWHISLSTWFKDYVYIPLGGNRKSPIRTYINLYIVFILAGFWHGASWNFLIWGLFHGFFIALEHAGFSKILNKIAKPFRHCYTLLIVLFAWVFFRTDNLSEAIGFIYSMFNFYNIQTTQFQFVQLLTYEAVYAFVIGIIISTPVYPWLKKKCSLFFEGYSSLIATVKAGTFLTLLVLSFCKLAASTYTPFIYFRF